MKISCMRLIFTMLLCLLFFPTSSWAAEGNRGRVVVKGVHRTKISLEGQAAIKAFQKVGKRGLDSSARKQLYRDAWKFSNGGLNLQDYTSIMKASSTALVEVNKQLARESGKRVPGNKILKLNIKKAQRKKRSAKTSWMKYGAETLVGELGSTQGMLVHDKHLKAREPNSKGELLNWVPGHGGDVWAVKHASGKIGVYSVSEITPAKPVKVKDTGLWLGE